MSDSPQTLKRTRTPQSVDYLQGYYTDLLKSWYSKRDNFKRLFNLRAPVTHLAGVLHYRPQWRDVIIAFLLGAVLFVHSGGHISPEPLKPYKVPKPIAQIAPTKLVEASEAIPVPVAPPIVQTAPVGVTACGSDPYMAQIYMRESGCRTDAINPIGACGLGQALPCSKMGCSLSDWDCQNAFFVRYAISVYGSPAAAWSAWQSKSWW